MSQRIIRTQSEIANASTADLVATYNALTGKSLARFESRGVAEARVANAILSAQNATGHLGVPANTSLQLPTLTAAERAEVRQFKSGTLAARLQERAQEVAPPPAEPLPKAPRRGALVAVYATGMGTSRPQPGSVRNAVLQAIVAAGHGGVSIAALDEQFKTNTRGHVLKLLEKNHVAPVAEELQA